jgi:uncharacterized membrane protein
MTMKKEKLILAAAIVGFAAIACALAAWKYSWLGFDGLDLAIYNNTFWQTIHGRFFASSIHPPSYLGDHAEWIILALAPLYALLPHPLTLVFLKIFALALSAIPVWLIARERLAGKRWAILFPLVWLANPYLWNLALFEFHIVTLAVPIALAAAYSFLRGRWAAFMIFVSLLLLSREDLAFVVAGFVILALFDKEKRRRFWRWIAVPAALAVVVFIIDQLLIARANPDGAYKFFVYYSWLGPTPGAAAAGLFLHPLRVLLHVLTFQNLALVVALFLPFLFLPILAPRWLAIAAIPFIELILTDAGGNAVILVTQYSALLLPGVVVSSAFGLEAALRKRRFEPVRPLIPFLLALAGLYGFVMLGPGAALSGPKAGVSPAPVAALKSIVAQIPPDASVAAGLQTLAPLSGREKIYYLSYPWLGKKQFGYSDYRLPELPDYIILDQHEFLYYTVSFPKTGWTAPLYAGGAKRLRELIAAGNYGVLYESDGAALLKKDAGGPWPWVRTAEKGEIISHPAALDLGPIEFLGWNREEHWRLYFAKTERSAGVDPVLVVNGNTVPLGNGLYPVSDWQADEIVEIALDETADRLTVEAAEISGGLAPDPFGSLLVEIERTEPIGAAFNLP